MPVCCESSEECLNLNVHCQGEENQACLRDGDCDSGYCNYKDEFTFGHIPEACTPQYFQFNHTYFCPGEESPNWNSGLGACVFKPEATIEDNWKKKSTVEFGNQIIIEP